jgi:prepilin-type N-terminal cleavage/methylation domain-containing protein
MNTFLFDNMAVVPLSLRERAGVRASSSLARLRERAGVRAGGRSGERHALTLTLSQRERGPDVKTLSRERARGAMGPLPTAHCPLPSAHCPRAGFTLVELLVTVTVIGILAMLANAGLNAARETARIARTKATIAKLNNVVMEMYDSYRTRRVPINFPATTSPQAAALTRLNAIRDIMRMEMPQMAPDDVTSDPVVSGLPRPALSRAYLARWNAGAPSTRFNLAEVFYMWVTMANPEVREQFAENEIGDVDNDGWPEFVDAWGNPIMFLRWAPQFLPPNSDVQGDRTTGLGDPVNDHDPFDPTGRDSTAFRLVPLVYSAGPDGNYGINAAGGYLLGNPYAGNVGRPQNDLSNDSVTAPGAADGQYHHYDNIHNHRQEVK